MGHYPCLSKISYVICPRVRLAISATLLTLGILQTKIFLLGRWTILLTVRIVGLVRAGAVYKVVHTLPDRS